MRKKIGGITLFLAVVLAAPVFAQDPSAFEPVGNRDVFQVSDITNVEGNIALKFRVDWSQVLFCLRVATRGANDSLLVTLQSTANPADTTSWQTVTTFDGRKAAVGNTVRVFPTGTAARDSTLPLFRYFRVSTDHSIDAWTAADTSTFYLFVKPAGIRIYP